MSGSDDNAAREPGCRKDGTPFKDGNQREDGSYEVGKYRPPEHGKFKKGDGRKRGKRKKGSENLATIWERELARKMTMNGETKNAAAWLVDAIIRRGITRSDRAAENALEHAGRIDRARERIDAGHEDKVIAAYFAQLSAEISGAVSEDVVGDEQAMRESKVGSSDADQ